MSDIREELQADYRSAGFGARLGAGRRAALLVVDVVQAYTPPSSALYAGAQDAVTACLELAAAARSAELPVVLTRVVFSADGRDGGMFYRKVPALRAFVEGSPDGAFVDSLHQDGDLVVSKQYASAFFATSLASTLHSLEVDTVVVCGMTTSGCVRATATDALNHGFAPMVAAHACGDRDRAVHLANLFDLDQKSADVIQRSEALSLMSARADG